MNERHHQPHRCEIHADLLKRPVDAGGRVYGERNIEEIECEEDEEIHREQKLHRRQHQDFRRRQLARGGHAEAFFLRLAEQLSYVDMLGIGAQHTRRRVWQPEGDDQANQHRDQQRRDDGKDLAHAESTEQSRERRSEDKSQIRRDRHLAEVGAAVGIVADIRQIGVGDRYISTGEPGQSTRGEQRDKRHG